MPFHPTQKLQAPKEFFVVDSKAYWMGPDGWSSCDVSDHSDDETPSGSTETIIRWADAQVIDPDDTDNIFGIEWLVINDRSWNKIRNDYQQALVRNELARIEELVNRLFHAPIAKFGPLDVLGHYGIHFALGGHTWVVFQLLDGSDNLGLQLDCEGQDGHEGCENQWSTFPSGYRYDGPSQDLRIMEFMESIVREFLTDGKITTDVWEITS